jgi:hypothetical protein
MRAPARPASGVTAWKTQQIARRKRVKTHEARPRLWRYLELQGKIPPRRIETTVSKKPHPISCEARIKIMHIPEAVPEKVESYIGMNSKRPTCDPDLEIPLRDQIRRL